MTKAARRHAFVKVPVAAMTRIPAWLEESGFGLIRLVCGVVCVASLVLGCGGAGGGSSEGDGPPGSSEKETGPPKVPSSKMLEAAQGAMGTKKLMEDGSEDSTSDEQPTESDETSSDETPVSSDEEGSDTGAKPSPSASASGEGTEPPEDATSGDETSVSSEGETSEDVGTQPEELTTPSAEDLSEDEFKEAARDAILAMAQTTVEVDPLPLVSVEAYEELCFQEALDACWYMAALEPQGGFGSALDQRSLEPCCSAYSLHMLCGVEDAEWTKAVADSFTIKGEAPDFYELVTCKVHNYEVDRPTESLCSAQDALQTEFRQALDGLRPPPTCEWK